jgi:hypothetical protein
VATRKTASTRAKDSDRTWTCQVLDSALAEGQLSMEEHRQRVSRATNATTLGELQSLVDDLQPTTAVAPFAATPSKLRSAPVVAALVAGAAILVSGVIAWALISNGPPPSDTATTSSRSAAAPQTHALASEPSMSAAESTPAPADPPAKVLGPLPNLHSAEGLTLVIDEIRKRFGDTTGYELAITPTEATLARPDPTDENSKLIYSFEGGWGDPSTRPRSDTDDVTDLGAFDVQAAADALQAAPETLRIAPGDVEQTFIDIDHIADPPPGTLELLVKVSTTAGTDGWIYLDGASNIKRVENPS